MTTPRKITQAEYLRIRRRLINKAFALSKKACGTVERNAYWLSAAFKPCSGADNFRQTGWKVYSPQRIHHFTSTPCNEYCEEKLPMATCLYQSQDDEYYTCRHKVGNCPWKK